MEFAEALVEGGEAGVPGAGELGEIGVSDLTVPGDSRRGDVRVREIVWPELVPWVGKRAGEDGVRGSGGLALADKQAYKTALSDRAGGEVLGRSGEPALRGGVMNVVLYEEGYEHIRVQEDGHWPSSSSRRTSSDVMIFPRRATGSPVSGLLAGSLEPPELRPRRISRATAWLNV
jgi:hypothetical protein